MNWRFMVNKQLESRHDVLLYGGLAKEFEMDAIGKHGKGIAGLICPVQILYTGFLEIS